MKQQAAGELRSASGLALTVPDSSAPTDRRLDSNNQPERETVQVSNLFDFSKKPHTYVSNSSSAAAVPVPGNSGKTIDLQQILRVDVDVKMESRLVIHTDPRSPGADRFRFIRMRLQALWSAGKVKSLIITSPLPQDGKSTIALNLATALAEGGKRSVLLIEADLHHPSLTKVLGLDPAPGLAECLQGGMKPSQALRRVEPLSLYLLQSGTPTGNPTDLLHTDALAGLMEELSSGFDWILIDAPPAVPLTDALSLAHHADAALLVAREGRTPKESLEKAISLLGREKVLGIILNGAAGLDRLYSGYYGYGENKK